MSVATEIARIQSDRNKIRTKLTALGLTTGTATLDDCATAVEGISDCGAVSATVMEGATYTIPKGYHNGSGTVSGIKGGGNYSLQSKTVTPTKSQVNVTPDSGYYGISDVTVNPIPDNYQDVTPVTAGAGDVLANKVIVDATGKTIAGTMPNNGAVEKVLDIDTPSYIIPKGYHSGSGTVEIVKEEKTVVPSPGGGVVTPTDGKVLSRVLVEPIPPEFADVSEVDATADDVLEGRMIVRPYGEQVIGTIRDMGKVNKELTPKDDDLDISHAYFAVGSSVVVSTQNYGTVTPTKSAQTITASDAFISKFTVGAIPDAYQNVTGVTATANKVLEGAKFVDSEGTVVEGTMPSNDAVSKTLGNGDDSYTIPAGYHDGSGTVSIKWVKGGMVPKKETQTLKAPANHALSEVTLDPIPDAYQDVTGVTATAATVLSGSKFVNSSGTLVTGSMTNRGKVTATIDGLTTTSYTIPAGYHNGSGTVSLTSDIEEALAAI